MENMTKKTEIEPERINEILKKVEDVEYYGPVIPLSWREYHSIIRELSAALQGEAVPHFDIPSELRTRLEGIMMPDSVDVWLNTRIPFLNGRRPIEAIQEGQAEWIESMIYWVGSGQPG